MNVGSLDACWNWTAATAKDGHGLIKVGGKKGRCIQAHRVSFIMHGGDPNTEVIRHSCDNPRCQNPAHLLPGTHADNVADRVSRGRSAVGERNGRSKLKVADIPVIRQMLREQHTVSSIARLYGVDNRVIRDIRDGKK
ncbi:MAG: HNH endonuclease [Bacillota bacterium]